MAGRSTATNLAVLTQYLSESIDNRKQVDVFYADLTKAFDHISHEHLLVKLSNLGVDNTLLLLINDYLINRSQFVEYNGQRSHIFDVPSGVPQGSNLGPLLFLAYINDLVKFLNCEVLIYADDVKIFNTIDNTVDCINLQRDIDVLNTWCLNNNLGLNISKCCIMTYSRKQTNITFNYTVTGSILDRKTVIKDLGIFFDSTLTFNYHIHNLKLTSLKNLGFIIRNSKDFRKIKTLTLLYYSFVRSKLEYCSIIWHPIYACQVNIIENIQRKCLKLFSFKCDGVYPAQGSDGKLMEQRFGITSLRQRRDLQALSFLYKLLHNAINCPQLLSKLNFHVPRVNTRCHLTFYISAGRTNCMYKSPINRMCSLFNCIDSDIDIYHNSLKCLLNNYLINNQL